MPRRAWLALIVVVIVLVVLLARTGKLNEASAFGAIGPVVPPDGWVLVGRAPGGWLYAECDRMVAVIVDDAGKVVGAATMMPTEEDLGACRAEEASGR